MERGVLSLKGSLAGALVLFTIAIISVYLFAYDAQTGKVLYAIAPFVGIANGWITPAQRVRAIYLLEYFRVGYACCFTIKLHA